MQACTRLVRIGLAWTYGSQVGTESDLPKALFKIAKPGSVEVPNFNEENVTESSQDKQMHNILSYAKFAHYSSKMAQKIIQTKLGYFGRRILG